jgi:hypothetical protein
MLPDELKIPFLAERAGISENEYLRKMAENEAQTAWI